MPDRRRFLAAAAGLTAALAGCVGGDSDGETAADAAASTPGAAGTGTPTAPAPDGGLDLREANVTAVSATERDGGYRFDVTLHHDDDGEEGYANWWQVEALDGSRLGRRDLAHPHGTREFTRSATVAVPDGAACVVVRGHDETHGYGGRAALVDPAAGAVRLVDQGPDRRSFGPGDCP